MNVASIALLLDELAAAPLRLRGVCARLDAAKLRVRPSVEAFSPLENVWHLHDIEREGYLVRIRHMLAEETPVLESLDGDRMAIERRYNELELAPAIEGFAAARAASMSLLAGLPEKAWLRQATFENRIIDLQMLIAMMVEHDRGHFSSIEGVPVASLAA